MGCRRVSPDDDPATTRQLPDPLQFYPEYVHRLGNVLEHLRAAIGENNLQPVLDVFPYPVRHADFSPIGKVLEPCGNVHAVAENVAGIDDDVADIDADPEFDPPVRSDRGVSLPHGALDLHGASHGIDGAGKFQQKSVPGGLYDAAAVLGDAGVDKGTAMLLQLLKGSLFIGVHEFGCNRQHRPQEWP